MNLSYYLEKIDGEYREKFELFRAELTEYNKKVNLTSITDEYGVKIKHFLDSVSGESLFFTGAKVVEIGSGGGFPSLPLKILRDDLDMTLVESTGKKCVFLNGIVDKLGLKGVKVINARAEDLAKDAAYREKFDCATARAVARMNVLCEYCLPFVRVGGRLIAYKGEAEEETKEAAKAIALLGGEIESREKLTLPNGDARTLICVRKTAPTPEKYPRGQGKEKKCPLV